MSNKAIFSAAGALTLLLLLGLFLLVQNKSRIDQERPVPIVNPDPDPIATALENSVQNLASGKIAFESPLNMKQSETRTVEVRIAKNLNKEIAAGLAAKGTVRVEDIKVGSLMVASLHGSNFQITPLTKEEQAVTDDNFTAWDWTVHPLDWGEQALYLNVCVRLQMKDGKEEQRCSPVYDRTIKVQVDPVYAATHFIKDDPKWTLSTVGGVLTFVGGCFAWIRKRLRSKKKTQLDP